MCECPAARLVLELDDVVASKSLSAKLRASRPLSASRRQHRVRTRAAPCCLARPCSASSHQHRPPRAPSPRPRSSSPSRPRPHRQTTPWPTPSSTRSTARSPPPTMTTPTLPRTGSLGRARSSQTPADGCGPSLPLCDRWRPPPLTCACPSQRTRHLRPGRQGARERRRDSRARQPPCERAPSTDKVRRNPLQALVASADLVLGCRYRGEVGDLVVGRIVEVGPLPVLSSRLQADVSSCVQVGPKRWKVETHASQNAVLMLSSINLPGGVQVRL